MENVTVSDSDIIMDEVDTDAVDDLESVTVSGSDIIMDEVDTDTITVLENVVLSDDTLSYIAETDVCIAFGIFFLIGLLLARMTWGRLG